MEQALTLVGQRDRKQMLYHIFHSTECILVCVHIRCAGIVTHIAHTAYCCAL